MKKVNLFAVLVLLTISSFAQWSQVNNGIDNLATGARLLGSTDANLFGVAIASGVFKTSNKGNSWSKVQVPSNFTSPPKCGFHFSGKFFVGMDNSSDCISYTSDEGATWTTPTGSPQSTVVRGFISLGSQIFSFTSSKGIFKSSDGGANWSEANTGLTNLNVVWMTSINTKLVAATNGAGVFISSDNGATWVKSNSGISGNLNGTFVWTIGTKLYFYTNQGNLLYSSTNDGSSWVMATKFPFLVSNTLGQTISIKEVYRKGNNLYVMARVQYGISISDSIYVSSNEGSTWNNITGNLPADVLGSGITEMDGDVFIAYGSADKGFYTRKGSVGINSSNISTNIEIYPNPFNDNLQCLNVDRREIKQVVIYDNQGRIVLSEMGNSTSINTSTLSNGVYFLEVLFSDNSCIRKKVCKNSSAN